MIKTYNINVRQHNDVSGQVIYKDCKVPLLMLPIGEICIIISVGLFACVPVSNITEEMD